MNKLFYFSSSQTFLKTFRTPWYMFQFSKIYTKLVSWRSISKAQNFDTNESVNTNSSVWVLEKGGLDVLVNSVEQEMKTCDIHSYVTLIILFRKEALKENF